MINDNQVGRATSAKSASPRPGGPSRLARTLRAFKRDLRGNIAITFGLATIPLTVAMGTAIDYSRAFMVQQRLGQALDAAALAVGSSIETDTDALADIAQQYFDTNYGNSSFSAPGAISIAIDNAVITMSANATVDTAIMGIVGIDHVTVGATTEVTKETRGAEIVLVLDNTGSMNSGGKIAALRQAAASLVEIVFGDEEEPELLRLGLVPFSASVNIGADMIDSGAIDTTGASIYNGVNFLNGNDALSMYGQITNRSWNGCVEAPPAPYDTLDVAPDPANANTLWVPYFAPDEPNGTYPSNLGYYYGNSYLNDGGGNYDMDVRQRRYQKYSGASVSVTSRGPDFNCTNSPLTPLTNIRADIDDAVDDMVAAGSTVIPIGLAWGWRLLSPTEPYTQGAPYDSEIFNKVLILMTDGANDIGSGGGPLNNHNKSWYSGYGHVAQGRLGTTSFSGAHAELDDRTAELCENIKETGIIVYTITFQLPNGPIKDLMRNCASSVAMYFDSPDNETLQNNFQTIGKQLRNLRLSK
jgi:Flp pilus assembly protein TadG